MGLWGDHVVPRMLEWGMRGEEFSRLRDEVVPNAHGTVLELGFGSGLNLPHYDATTVERIVAVEPASVARKLARKRLAASELEVEFREPQPARLPLEDAAVDTVVSTWTLCSIPGVEAILADLRRVLRPGGAFHFLEHGLSPRPGLARWQARLNPIQKCLIGGCQLILPIDRLIEGAGFVIESLDHPPIKGPSVATYLYRGVAR